MCAKIYIKVVHENLKVSEATQCLIMGELLSNL